MNNTNVFKMKKRDWVKTQLYNSSTYHVSWKQVIRRKAKLSAKNIFSEEIKGACYQRYPSWICLWLMIKTFLVSNAMMVSNISIVNVKLSIILVFIWALMKRANSSSARRWLEVVLHGGKGILVFEWLVFPDISTELELELYIYFHHITTRTSLYIQKDWYIIQCNSRRLQNTKCNLMSLL